MLLQLLCRLFSKSFLHKLRTPSSSLMMPLTLVGMLHLLRPLNHLVHQLLVCNGYKVVLQGLVLNLLIVLVLFTPYLSLMKLSKPCKSQGSLWILWLSMLADRWVLIHSLLSIDSALLLVLSLYSYLKLLSALVLLLIQS